MNRLAAVGVNTAADTSTVFEQSFKQLYYTPAAQLRQVVQQPHLAFEVILNGEHVVGEAGPYRAFFADVCSELLTGVSNAPSSPGGDQQQEKAVVKRPSGIVPFFVPVPNAQMQHGENRDRWMIRYACRNQSHLLHFEVGAVACEPAQCGLSFPPHTHTHTHAWPLLCVRASQRACRVL